MEPSVRHGRLGWRADAAMSLADALGGPGLPAGRRAPGADASGRVGQDRAGCAAAATGLGRVEAPARGEGAHGPVVRREGPARSRHSSRGSFAVSRAHSRATPVRARAAQR